MTHAPRFNFGNLSTLFVLPSNDLYSLDILRHYQRCKEAGHLMTTAVFVFWCKPSSTILDFVKHQLKCLPADPFKTSVNVISHQGGYVFEDLELPQCFNCAPKNPSSGRDVSKVLSRFDKLQLADKEEDIFRKSGQLVHTYWATVNKDQILPVLMDTGASHSFVSSSLMRKMHIPIHKISALDVSLANETTTTITGLVDFNIKLGNNMYRLTAYVFDSTSSTAHTFIQGNSFMLRYGASLNFRPEPHMILYKGNTPHTLYPITHVANPPPTPKPLSFTTWKQAQHAIAHGATSFCLWLLPFDSPLLIAKNTPITVASATVPSNKLPPDPTLVDPDDLKALIEEYSDVFEEVPAGLPPLVGTGHTIPLEPGTIPPKRPLFRLSPAEIAEARKQVSELLEKGWIVPSQSPFGAPIMFVNKKDDTLRMVIDYRALNSITIKNRWPMPRIDDIFDQLSHATIFSSIDLTSGYHQIRLDEVDQAKTAFVTPFGLYEFKVLPFGLTNAPATFQSTMSKIFSDYISNYVLAFLDDILVYSKSPEEHLEHLRTVLERLREYRLFAKLKKCDFNKSELRYLGFIIGRHGLKPDPEKIVAVQKFRNPKNVTDIKSFLGLANQFRKFVLDFAMIAEPLTRMTRKSLTFCWGEEQEKAFNDLKHAITNAPVLALPDFEKTFTVKADASGLGIGAVLLQDDRPLAYFSRKLSNAEANYSVGEQELLALHDALLHWRCYLEGPEVVLVTDHCPLRYLKTQPMLSRRQARWVEFFSRFHYTIMYRPGRTNVADPLSRYPVGDAPSVNAIDVHTSPRMHTRLLDAYTADDRLRSPRFLRRITKEGEYWFKLGTQRLFIPNDPSIKNDILFAHHDQLLSGHMGIDKTIQAISAKFWWPGLSKDVYDHVTTCTECQAVNARSRKREGQLCPLPIPDYPWQQVSMDFITGMPVTPEGHDAIFVIIDRLTKMVLVYPVTMSIDAPTVAELLFKEVVCRFGQPEHIVCDRDPRFTSRFFKAYMDMAQTKVAPSTTYHPQTDGQTERINRVIEDVLRCYVSDQGDDWHKHLRAAEFAINNSVQASTGFTPFYLNYGRNPRMPFDHELNVYDAVPEAARRGQLLYENLSKARLAIEKAQKRQTEYYNRNRAEPVYAPNQLVWLSTENLRRTTAKVATKRWCGPFAIDRMVGRLAAKLRIPENYRIHDVFHVSLLKPYHARPGLPTPYVPPPLGESEDPILEVELVLEHEEERTTNGKGTGKYRYYIKWLGFPMHDASWEPEDHISASLIRDYWARRGGKKKR